MRLTTFLLVGFYIRLQAQAPQIDARSQRLVKEIKSNFKEGRKEISFTPSNQLKKRYSFSLLKNEWQIHALVTAGKEFKEAISSLKIPAREHGNGMWSFFLPVNEIPALLSLPGIKKLSFDSPVNLRLDKVRKETGADALQNLSNYAGLRGTGVLIGIIDNGFDLTHPTFYDTTGTVLRITSVWVQQDTSGTPPIYNGISYGTELTSSYDMLNYGTTNPQETHGTHVAGIAAGSGNGTNGQYRGMAPNANLILVEIGTGGVSSIIDAIYYILSTASLLNQPVVINMSLGSHIGPHDGTSDMDQAIDYYTSYGAIVVGAAGNEGSTDLHLLKNFNGTGVDTLSTIISFVNGTDDYSIQYNGTNTVDVWGSANTSFSIGIVIYDHFKNQVANFTPIGSAQFVGSDSMFTNLYTTFQGDTIGINYYGVNSDVNNNKPEIQLDLYSNTNQYFVGMQVVSFQNNAVHAWNNGGDGAGAPFLPYFFTPQSGRNYLNGYVRGDTLYTVGEIGGTSKSIIATGAYVSKNSFNSLEYGYTTFPGAVTGAAATFSSVGPTVDGRIKPDITAPGETVVSSYNSFDTDYGISNLRTVKSVPFGGFTYYYGALEGTSMATPAVTGAIALLLQTNNSLTYADVKSLIQTTARTDTFTGNLTGTGNNKWGAGKLNIEAAARQNVLSNYATGSWVVFPNPSGGTVYLLSQQQDCSGITVQLTDVVGRLLPSWTTSQSGLGCTFDVSQLTQGVYILKIMNNGTVVSRQKLVVRAE